MRKSSGKNLPLKGKPSNRRKCLGNRFYIKNLKKKNKKQRKMERRVRRKKKEQRQSKAQGTAGSTTQKNLLFREIKERSRRMRL